VSLPHTSIVKFFKKIQKGGKVTKEQMDQFLNTHPMQKQSEKQLNDIVEAFEKGQVTYDGQEELIFSARDQDSKRSSQRSGREQEDEEDDFVVDLRLIIAYA
jgi:predicted Zn-dependent protease